MARSAAGARGGKDWGPGRSDLQYSRRGAAKAGPPRWRPLWLPLLPVVLEPQRKTESAKFLRKRKKNGGSGLQKKGGMVRRLVWRFDSVILGRPVCPRNSCLVGPKIVRPKWEIEYLRKKWLVQECRIRTSHFAFKTAVLQFRFGFRLSCFLQHYARFWAIIHFGCEKSAVFARKWLVRGFSD